MKKFFIIASVTLIVLVGLLFGVLSIATAKPTVAFYNVDEKVIEAVKSEMASMTKKNGKPLKIEFVSLDNTIPMSSQAKVKKAHMIFASLDADVEDYAKNSSKVIPLDSVYISEMPSSIREATVKNNKGVLAVPLLFDFNIVDVQSRIFNESGLKTLAVWNDLVELGKWASENEDAPIMFPGKDDESMVDLIGGLTEALCGKQVLEEAEKKIYDAFKSDEKAKDKKYTSLSYTMEQLIEDGGVLNPAVTEIRKLVSAKAVNDISFQTTSQDMIFFMENRIPCAMINSLSQHRNVEHKYANYYGTVYYPGVSLNSDRKFQAKELAVISQSKNKDLMTVVNLLTSSRQSNLSIKTGLAPANSSCSALDRQSDDVRYWLAASDGPVKPLSLCVPSKDALEITAEILRRNARVPYIEK